jgi:hypothetical protein
MEIRFVSSLTIEDENRLAPAVLQALAALLHASQLAYTVRIETAGGEVFEHQQAPHPVENAAAREMPRLPAISAQSRVVTPFRY